MKELKTKKDLDEDTERPQTKKKRKFRLLFQRSEEPQFEPLSHLKKDFHFFLSTQL